MRPSRRRETLLADAETGAPAADVEASENMLDGG
jgi:hypothetical protein